MTAATASTLTTTLAMSATITPVTVAPTLVWVRPITRARPRRIIARRRLVITRRRVITLRWRVVTLAVMVIRAAAVVIRRRGRRVDLGTVIGLAATVIRRARRKGQTEQSDEKQSTIHGGLLDRGRAPPATREGGIHLSLNDEISDIKNRIWCDLVID